MKKYIIKPEHLDSFGPEASMENRIIDETVIEYCARGWDMTVEEVLDMVEEYDEQEDN